MFFGFGIYAINVIKKDEVLKGMKYLKESWLAFSIAGSYLSYQAIKNVNNIFDSSKRVLYTVSFKKDFSKLSDDKLLNELKRLNKLEDDYVPALSPEKLSYYFELYKRGLIDFKSFTRELSLSTKRFYTTNDNALLVILGYIISRGKELFIKQYKDESSEMNRLINKITFMNNINRLSHKIFEEKIKAGIEDCITKIEKIIINTNKEGCDLAALLFRSIFLNKPEYWRKIVEKSIQMKEYAIDRETEHSITIHLKDDLFSIDVFECKILKSDKELERLIDDYLDMKFADKAFSEELKQKPNNSVVKPLFLGRINLEGKEVVAMSSMKRVIGIRADEFLRNAYDKNLSAFEENEKILKEIIRFQWVLTKRFYNEEYRYLKEFSNKEYLDEKFFSRLEKVIYTHNFGSKELCKISDETKNSEALNDFLNLEVNINTPNRYVVVHGDSVTSNIIKYFKESERIKIEFTTFYDHNLMLASPNFDIYSYVEDQRNLLCEEEKLIILSEAHNELTKKGLFSGNENDFLKSYFLMQNLRDCCTGVMFLDYALNFVNQAYRNYFLENATKFIRRNITNNYLVKKKIGFKGEEAKIIFNYESVFSKLKRELLNEIREKIK
jgi:hypothetical protein